MGTIYGRGMFQDDLVTLLTLINTNLTGVLAKLDADSGVTGEDYESTLKITFPSTEIQARGLKSQGAILDYLDDYITNFNALLTKLDDENLGDSDYNSTLAITDNVDPTAGGTADAMWQRGMPQGRLVKLLNTIITQFNLLNAKLDLDGTVNGTNYASLWNVTDTVDTSGC